jgi:integrase
MIIKLTPVWIKQAPAPTDGRTSVIHYDAETRGLGVRVTKAGARSWILGYTTKTGLQRRMTIGNVADWPLQLAREEAHRLRRIVDTGGDPLGERETVRVAPTVAHLIERWREDEAPKKRKRTRVEYEGIVRQWIEPELGARKVADVKRVDVEKLHTKISKSGTAVRANRTIALLGRLFSLAVGWEMRPANPVTKIERNTETARYRIVNEIEMGRLLAALATQRNQQAGDIIRLLLLTGARRGEVLAMQWSELDLDQGLWTKPAATTKQNRLHRIPLNGPARQLLIEIKTEAEEKAARYSRPISRWVFPAQGRRDQPIGDIKTSWRTLCRKAGITDLHLHDLRHAYATYLASSGSNLPVIGQLLGHTQAATTQRYAHLLDDPLRVATERVGAMISAIETGKTSEVLPLRRPRR